MNPFEEIDNRIAEDSEFQGTINDLSDDEKSEKIKEKRDQLISEELIASKKNKELADNYKTRSEKAEGDLKKYKPAEEKKNEENLSTKDLIALAKEDVSEQVVDEVIEYAKFKKITVAEAMKSGYIKSKIEEDKENAKTAKATQTRSTRQTTKTDGNEILNNIRDKGEDSIPNAGSSEAEEVFWARRGGRR